MIPRHGRYRGAGARQLLAAKGKPELLVVTFGKGFGVSGAAVFAPIRWRIIYCNLPAILFTAQYAARSGAGITCIAGGHSQYEGDARREKLAALITRFRAGYRICRLRLLIHAAPSSH